MGRWPVLWRPLACRVCGRAPLLEFRWGSEVGELLCVCCRRWLQAWELGLVVAADQLAQRGFAQWRAPDER